MQTHNTTPFRRRGPALRREKRHMRVPWHRHITPPNSQGGPALRRGKGPSHPPPFAEGGRQRKSPNSLSVSLSLSLSLSLSPSPLRHTFQADTYVTPNPCPTLISCNQRLQNTHLRSITDLSPHSPTRYSTLQAHIGLHIGVHRIKGRHHFLRFRKLVSGTKIVAFSHVLTCFTDKSLQK